MGMKTNQNDEEIEIEVRTAKCQNYDFLSSFHDYCPLLICKITKIFPLLMVHLFR